MGGSKIDKLEFCCTELFSDFREVSKRGRKFGLGDFLCPVELGEKSSLESDRSRTNAFGYLVCPSPNWVGAENWHEVGAENGVLQKTGFSCGGPKKWPERGSKIGFVLKKVFLPLP